MAFSKQTIAKILLIRKLRRRLRRKERSCDIRPIFFNRVQSGESKLARELRDDPYYHHVYFRMSKETFDELFEKVSVGLSMGKTHCRPISKLEKIAVTLRYLATGNSQMSLAFSYRISPSAIGKLLRETMLALCHVLEQEYLPVPTTDQWSSIEAEFANNWNFPNCCGAIDGKHIRIRAPKLSGSMNFNYKGYFSIVLLAIIDAKYKFVLVDIGASGSQSDGGVLSRSAIGRALENGNLNLPEDKQVGGFNLPHVIVADDAFPLRNNLMKPFPGRGLTTERRIFNYRMSRARMVSENGFGILASRWRIFHTVIDADLEFSKLIVKTCVLLHNFLMDKKDACNITADQLSREKPEELLLGNWRESPALLMSGLMLQGSNNYSISASVVRERFTDYFNGVGAVSWQNRML